MTDEQYEELEQRVKVLEHGLLELIKLIDHLVDQMEQQKPRKQPLAS